MAIVRRCPECGALQELRDGRFGKFWGCSTYPKCHYTESASDNPYPFPFRPRRSYEARRRYYMDDTTEREMDDYWGLNSSLWGDD